MLNTNSAPYFDTFNEDKKFYQVLFRPSLPVQTRELNEMQSILQNQIERFGSHVFKEGSMVIPGQVSVDMKYAYVKIQSTFNSVSVAPQLQDMIDNEVILIGQTTGVTAKIINFTESTDTDELTIYVKYISSGTDGIASVFVQNEELFTDETTPRGMQVSTSDTATGYGCAANIQKGVYFVRGRFVMVAAQTLIVEKYKSVVNAKIGLRIVDSFITPEEDESLLDNAAGSTNYAAPGAHRYFMDLILSIDDGSTDFIDLITINNGRVSSVTSTSSYSVLEETLARRTYDESGNYTITPFNIHIKEHRNNDRGIWEANVDYLKGDIVEYNGITYVVDSAGRSGITPPTHTSGSVANGGTILLYEETLEYNDGVYSAINGGNSEKFAVGIDVGKAYVQGYEITNQSTVYLPDDKALTYDSTRNSIVPITVGSYVKVKDVFGSLNVTSYPEVKLYDRFIVTPGTASGTLVGTARARYIEYDSGTVGSNANYLLSLVDVKMNSGKSFEGNVRSIYFDNSAGVDFTANLIQEVSRVTGSVNTTNNTTAVTGIGTRFLSEFNPGDAMLFYSGTTAYTRIIASIASDTSLTLTENAGATVSGALLYKALTRLYESTNSRLLMQIPHSYIRKLRSIDNELVSNAAYYVRNYYSSTVVGGQIIINTAAATETFASPQQPDSFMVVNATTGAILLPSSITLNGGSTAATIVVGAAYDGDVLSAIATIRKSLKEKIKSAIKYYSEDFTTQVSAQSATVTLGKVDGIRLRKVTKFVTSGGTPIPFGSPIPVDAVPVDITGEYDFNSGQTDAFYGNAYIVRRTGSIIPDSPIRVTYDYFEHDSNGDYFSVDSYGTELAGTYTSTNGIVYPLRDCVDFRPAKNGNTFSAALVPAIGYDFTSDYTYYLPRIDKLYLQSNGNFGIVQGVPSLNPGDPEVPKNSMLLATIYLAAKTETVGKSTIRVVQEDNRRYTMRDIGKIDKRLQNVEYQTALSLLEQQTYNLQLFDSAGNLNFKNGFIVDPFTGQNIGDTKSEEYRCSIDSADPSMRPGFSREVIEMYETALSDADRLTKGYTNKNNIITLPYTEVTEIDQPYASRAESIVPFIQFNFLGSVELTPPTDTWYETTYAPAVVINQEGNYSAIVNQYRSQLGTVWGEWNTVSSTSTSTSQLGWWDGWLVNVGGWGGMFTTTTTTTTSNQVRSGTNTQVVAVYDNKVVDDKVINVSVLPFIRSRHLVFKATGMRPQTNMYAFFDQTNVTQYCTPASIINLSGKTGEFNTTTVAGYDADFDARRMSDGTGTVALTIGDIVHNGTGGNINLASATAIVVIDEDTTIKVVNTRGTFVAGQTVYGTISGATATVQSVEIPTNIKSNIYGEAAGIFKIPSSTALRFASGQRTFSLSSSNTNAADASSIAKGTYTAVGYLSTRQQTIVSTRNGVVQQTSVSDSRVIQSTQTVETFARPSDPLAQSFMVDNPDGMFVTSVDIYFAAKDRTTTMWFEIVEVATGLPTRNVIPGSRVIIKPNQVTTSNNSSVATRIYMNYPVYLNGNTEYAFVMGSDSPTWMVWVSHLGETDLLTGRNISRQPHLGSMFKSQNASTWNPSQLDDIKFRINRANFNINTSGNVTLEARSLDLMKLEDNPFFVNVGSNKIRVFANNHGLTVGSKVTISGSTVVGNIPANELNKQHTVTARELDSFVITVTTAATSTGYYGGNNVYSSRNIRMDVASLNSTQITFEGTSIRHYISPTNTSYVIQAEATEISPYVNTTMSDEMIIASKENEASFLAGQKSLKATVQLTSTNSYLSPVIDMFRYSIAAVGNRINNPSSSQNIAGLDSTSLGSSTTIGFSGNNLTSATTNALFLRTKAGCYVTISGAVNGANNGTFLVKEVDPNGLFVTFADKTFTTEAAGATISLTIANRFVSEIAPIGGTADAKYIIKTMTLDLPANQLSVYFDVSKPDDTEVDLYYRVSNTGAGLANRFWTKLAPVNQIARSDNPSVFNGAQYKLESTTEFATAQIKLVLRSDHTNLVPIIKNLRMIAMS